MTKPSRTTARDLVRAAQAIPRADAEFLLISLLRVPRHELYAGQTLRSPTVRRFLGLAARARTGTPVQYLVRSAPFLDLDLYVDRRVLIPRPETEELVLRAVTRLRSAHSSLSRPTAPAPSSQHTLRHSHLVLDYGTGSGCIAIALARLVPGSRVVAVDTSRAALAVARRNVARYGLASRIRLVCAASLTGQYARRLAGRIDLLIANPPYVPTPRLRRLARRVRDHEPKISLDGGPKGTNIVEMILEQGPSLLRPGGLLAMEVDSTHRRFALDACPTATVEADLCGRPRYAFWSKPGKGLS